ncbi:hypothetical protein YC2023_066430 [Brassica napus]
METTNFSKLVTVPVALKGGSNYLMWSQLVRTTIGRLGLWNHITDDGPEPVAKEDEEEGDGKTLAVAEAKRWVQEDLMVLSVLHASLELPILEAYVHFETPKRLWDMLHKRYGNKSNISRVFDLKQTISVLRQDGEDLTKHMGKFGALWSELESLRPNTTDEESLIERREQDQVFELLMTLDESYQDVIKHILRSPTLPSMEEVCAQLQKEEGSLGLFGGKKGMSTAHKAEEAQANKAAYRGDGRKYEKYEGSCEHCKRQGHKKSQCWILHPHLRPSKFNKDREAKAHLSAEASGAGSSGASPNVKAGESEGRALTSQEVITKADFEAFIRALKESGKMLGNTLGYSYSAHTLPSISDKLLDIFKTSCTATAHTSITDRLLGVVKSLKAENETSRINTARNLHKPLIIDSGASHHMISDNNLIKDIEPALGHVMIANGDRIPIRGIGKLNLFNKDSKAFYMPEFTSNLLSVKKCTTDLQCNVIFSPNDVKFQDIKSSKLIGQGATKGDLYMIEDLAPISSSCFSFSSVSSLSTDALWHARLGHPHVRALSIMLPGVMFKNNDCEACILGKHCKTVFQRSSTLYANCFDLIHSDVWTAPCLSRDDYKYYVTFIDEKSKYTWLTLIKTKDRVLDAFKNFQAYVTNQYHAKIKIFRSDNGGEYTGHAFRDHLAQHGILHQTSCPYTPQQNGVAERKNRHLMEVSRSMMFHKGIPKRYWSDAVMTACYLINRIPTRILADQSPFEVLNKSRPVLDHLRTFGCVCYVLVPGEQRNKLEAKSTKAMMIGYSTSQKGYKCYDPTARRVLVSRDVRFMEDKGYYDEQTWEDLEDLSQPSERAACLRNILEGLGIGVSQDQSRRPEPTPAAAEEPSHFAHEGGSESVSELEDQGLEEAGELGNRGTDSPVQSGEGSAREELNERQNEEDQRQGEARAEAEEQTEAVTPQVEEEQEMAQEGPVLRRSTRLRRDPSSWVNTRVYYNAQAVKHPTQAVCSFAQYPEAHCAFMVNLDENHIPRSYEEAMEDEEWKESVGAEAGAMIKNDTWYESELPKGKKAVSSRWIFTVKYKADGSIERKKTRLVARGFTQTYGEDYIDTFAPVAKLHTIRIVLSVATNLGWDLWQMDVKNAFLQGELEDEVYMLPPPGLEGMVKPGNVLRLKKAIYGLKQSPRAWYHKLSTTLNGRGFRKSELDHTLFTLTTPAGIVVLLVYVDDIVITGSDKVGIKETKEFLKSVFDIKDLGEMKYFLGIELCRSEEGLFISQRKYILDLLKEAGAYGGKTAKMPMEDGYKAPREGELEDSKVFHDPKLYRKLVGKLIYLTITRPDICFAVNQVSQHMQAPREHHWRMVERVLMYLNGTQGLGIWMGCNGSTEAVGYCDADWAGDRTDRRSTTGYCTFIGGNMVTWKSKKQKVVSCSSAEAEYRAMLKLTNELVWIKGILKHLEIEQATPMTMHCDNQAAIHIATNSVFHERTKHIEVDCHKVRQMIVLGVILLCYTRSEDQLADVFTKAARQKTMESIHIRLGFLDLSPKG